MKHLQELLTITETFDNLPSLYNKRAALRHDLQDAREEGDTKRAQKILDKLQKLSDQIYDLEEKSKRTFEERLKEGIQPVKTISKFAYYRESAVTASLKKKLEKAGKEFDVTVTYGKPKADRFEVEKFVNIKLTGTRNNIKQVAAAAALQMNDDSLNEGKDLDELVDAWMEHNNAWRTEGPNGVQNFEKLIHVLGYHSIDSFLEDNPGVIESMFEWIRDQKIQEWKEALSEFDDKEDQE